jgi:hypothetical protein
MFAVASR